VIARREFRIGIVGASSLAGKELSDTLADSALAACDIALLDEDDVAGQLTAAGDEAAFIQKIEPESFTGLDFVFFTGAPATTKKYWKAARRDGASLIDMTYALEAEPAVVVRGPWAGLSATAPTGHPRAQQLNLTTPAVVSAHPAALMLLLVANRLHASHPLRAIAATVFEPASEHGRAAMDELHQQTVCLLSFQNLPREQFGAQAAFNLLPALGDDAKVDLAATESRIAAHFAALSAGVLPPLALQLVQAPVFHGYVISLLVELQQPATAAQLEEAAYGEQVDLVDAHSGPPSNLSAVGQSDVLLRIGAASPNNATPAGSSSEPGDAAAEVDLPSTRFWLWLAADNLKLAALNAIACASELRRLRPLGKVQ
jgi:aspartate-semialdehyde dehydrogenase